jgi:hypothetical protein
MERMTEEECSEISTASGGWADNGWHVMGPVLELAKVIRKTEEEKTIRNLSSGRISRCK